eukprot:TRINITY_DN952_c0_g1_i1.p1 TRINITY_DN952_c0_g1~~TRINITY_DN952_c0_g1_i1.p1  ORF type:complete len:506 (-),score=103.61 TRINITY_DN952_c0_g1_i1:93-1610(-)
MRSQQQEQLNLVSLLSRRGQNRSESLSDSEYSLDEVLPEGNPIRTNLGLRHDKYLQELIKSPLVENQEEIVENYDIFLNCIYWQVKGLRGRSSTRRASVGIKDEFYKYLEKPPPATGGLSIDADDMLCLDSDGEESLADHDAKFKKYKELNSKTTDKNALPLPPPSKRLTRRNSAGPFLERSAMEHLFQKKDVAKVYNIGNMIAKGAFGRVFLATSPQGEQVAIKTTDLKVDPSRIHNIAIEIHLLVTCAHPNVVKHNQSFYWEQEIWSVMEFCNGGAITSLRKVKLSENQLRFIMNRLMGAVAHMHENRVAHRDLKCANIMLKMDYTFVNNNLKLLSAEPKIGDFGLSCLATEGKKQSAMCGSRYWMSPEMIQRVGYDLKTDLYSLGCVMYELMTGRAPYRKQGGLIAIFYHATKGCEPLPLEEQKVYSQGCQEFLQKLTRLNPADRPDANTLVKDKWLTKSSHLPTVLGDAINTAYENIGPYFVEKLLRPKYRKRLIDDREKA